MVKEVFAEAVMRSTPIQRCKICATPEKKSGIIHHQ
jgi:hypothetical protein